MHKQYVFYTKGAGTDRHVAQYGITKQATMNMQTSFAKWHVCVRATRLTPPFADGPEMRPCPFSYVTCGAALARDRVIYTVGIQCHHPDI